MLLYIPIHRPIHNVSNVVELILLADLEGQPMLSTCASAILSTLAEKKLRKSGNDYAQTQPRVNQERFKKCFIGKLNRFNQNWFRLKRLIPLEHDLYSLTSRKQFSL